MRDPKRRRLIQGIGINDSPVDVTIKRMGEKTWIEPIYGMWSRMLRRCYDSNWRAEHKTYSCVSLDSSWVYLMNFREWAAPIYDERYYLDKDLLSPESHKIYSPETCCFLPQNLNVMLGRVTMNKNRELPIGVTHTPDKTKYRARFRGQHLGRFSVVEKASKIYNERLLEFLEGELVDYRKSIAYDIRVEEKIYDALESKIHGRTI